MEDEEQGRLKWRIAELEEENAIVKNFFQIDDSAPRAQSVRQFVTASWHQNLFCDSSLRQDREFSFNSLKKRWATSAG